MQDEELKNSIANIINCTSSVHKEVLNLYLKQLSYAKTSAKIQMPWTGNRLIFEAPLFALKDDKLLDICHFITISIWYIPALLQKTAAENH